MFQEEWIIDSDATCTQKGSKHNECSKCEEVVDIVEIPMLAHSYSAWETTTAPTCGDAGIETRVCSGCGKTENRDVDALSHTWLNWVVVEEPTCEENGQESRTCSGCGEIETKDTQSLGHSYGVWTQTSAPTCETAGV